MLRSILAVLVGFVAMAVVVMIGTAVAMRALQPHEGDATALAMRLNPAYLTANLVLSGVAALIGGYVVATIARHDPIRHGIALALLILVMSVVSMRRAGATQPRWYQLTLATAMPLIAIGGSALLA